MHKDDYISNGIPLVNPIHMKDFHIIAEKDFTISNEKAKELTKYILKKEIKANLKNSKVEAIKKISFDLNKQYEDTIIGQRWT